MGKKGPEDASKTAAKWSAADDVTLVETFKTEKDKANWGDNGPKPVVYTEAMKALAGSEVSSGGGPKNVQAIKNRWQKVCTPRSPSSKGTDSHVLPAEERISAGEGVEGALGMGLG